MSLMAIWGQLISSSVVANRFKHTEFRPVVTLRPGTLNATVRHLLSDIEPFQTRLLELMHLSDAHMGVGEELLGRGGIRVGPANRVKAKTSEEHPASEADAGGNT